MTNEFPAPAFDRSTSAPRRLRAIRASAAAILVTTLAACSTAAVPGPSSAGTGTPTTNPTPLPSPTIAGLAHPTGAKDVVLRFEESGGFVPVEFMATYAPSFTLYGDGTVVFRDPTAMPPESTDNVVRSVPFKTVRIDEEAIQALLNEALGPGALAIAKGPYTGMVADIPTSTFTISIAGQTKQVSVTGLSPESHDQDKAIVTALAALAQKLNSFGNSVGGAQPYAPSAYRGVVMPVDQPFGPVLDWPWAALTPDDFTSGDNEFIKSHVLTPAEVDAVGIKDIAGGMTGIALQSKGKTYTFSLRPLLPDESR